MPYVIRHIETGEIVKMRSGKSVWAKVAHAKASFKTSGLHPKDRARFDYKPDGNTLDAAGFRLGRAAWGFDHQSIFEIVEAKLEPSDQMKRAVALLTEATFLCADDITLLNQIHDFIKEVRQ